MYFESISDFIAMGGHGFYVWLAYGVSAAVIVGYLVSLRLMRRRVLEDLSWQADSEDSTN